MRVTLVHPAGYNVVLGQPDFSVLANRMAPTGLLSLAAWLEQRGHESFVVDCLGPRAPAGTEAQAEKVLATDPELVGFSATTSGFLDGYDIARHIKRKRPHVKIMFGSVHPSSIGAPLLTHFPLIDYLCIGEGEGLMGEIADGMNLKDIGNLVWRDGDEVVTNPRRERMRSLDDLPFPAYHKLEGFPRGYHLPPLSYIKRYGATMITSRGCPYTCSYCDRTVFERIYRYNSSEYVWDHMRRLRDEYGVHHINFYDDLFTASRKRVVELCELLIRKPLGMDYNCAIRVGHSDDELLGLLKRSGCLQVSMGVESADPGMMDRHKTGVTLEQVRDTVERVHAQGMRAKGLFIFGLPGETPATIHKTSDWIQSMDFDEMNMTKFTPFHGAPLWEDCVSGEEGSFHEDWRLMNCLNFVYIPRGFESREQMDHLYNRHLKRYYESKAYIKRFKKRLWEHRWTLWHVLKNLPGFLAARRHFDPDAKRPAQAISFPLHECQPARLEFEMPDSVQRALKRKLPVKLVSTTSPGGIAAPQPAEMTAGLIAGEAVQAQAGA
jgi:magnesium-protoporphyrin IX monomethyl ester (oxidative) cyclase